MRDRNSFMLLSPTNIKYTITFTSKINMKLPMNIKRKRIHNHLDSVEKRIKSNYTEKVNLSKEKDNLLRDLQNDLKTEAKEKGFYEGVEVMFFRKGLGMKKPFRTKILTLYLDKESNNDRELKVLLSKLPEETNGKFFFNPTVDELKIIKQ